MSNLTIHSKEIRLLDGLYSLNDLHILAGGKKHHQPSNSVRTKQTKNLITEIARSSDMRNVMKTTRGGKYQGTFVCKELVYAYAMTISPKFHLQVIRAFDEMQAQRQLPQLRIPDRFLVRIRPDGKQDVKEIPNDAFVATPDKLPEFISGLTNDFTNSNLKDVINTCVTILTNRATRFRNEAQRDD